MTKPSITIYDHATGETTVREMDDVEFAEHLAITQQAQADKEARETLIAEKQSAELEAITKLTALGLNPLAFGLTPATLENNE